MTPSACRGGPTPQVRLAPLAPASYDAWTARSVAGFVEQRVAAGHVSAAWAESSAHDQLDRLLPLGPDTPGHHLLDVLDGPDGHDVVGALWLRLLPGPAGPEAYVVEVEVAAHRRGRGLGRATMLAAERLARDLGARRLALTVLAHNAPAIALYESLGYVVTDLALTARLDGCAPAPSGLGVREVTAQEWRDYRARLDARGPGDPDGRRPDAAGLLTRGRHTPGHLLWAVTDADGPLGTVWLEVPDLGDRSHALGHDLEVVPSRRGPGQARRVLAATLSACRDRGLATVGVTLAAGPSPLQAALGAAGFAVTAQRRAKPL